MHKKILFFLFFSLLMIVSIGYASRPAVTQPIPINDIVNYDEYPLIVKKLITQALELTQKNLTYLYGSSDPTKGGMDCSGTIYYLLKLSHLTGVPRPSNEMFKWVVNNGKFNSVTTKNFNSQEFSHLKPGDLLFWEGTYKTNRNPPISHVMLFLGKNQKNQLLMFGSSNGRTYQGKSMWGVSVFDFKLPNSTSSARFIGYSCIPHLTCDSERK